MPALKLQSLWSVTAPPGPVCAPLSGAQRFISYDELLAEVHGLRMELENALGELVAAGVSLALYPLSAFRAMNKAALGVYQTIRREGTQRSVVDAMQTRAELYEVLGYHGFEAKLDQLFKRDRGQS